MDGWMDGWIISDWKLLMSRSVLQYSCSVPRTRREIGPISKRTRKPAELKRAGKSQNGLGQQQTRQRDIGSVMRDPTPSLQRLSGRLVSAALSSASGGIRRTHRHT